MDEIKNETETNVVQDKKVTKITREKINAIKEQFVKLGDFEKEIDGMVDAIQIKIKNMKFNPKTNNINETYDIMDDIQDWQAEIGKILIRALDYEEATELLEATVNSIYDNEEKSFLISDILRSNGFKNIDEKKAWINKQLDDASGINDFIKFMNKQRIKSEYALKRVNVLSDVVEKQDNKLSRKISVMNIQSQKGMLGSGDNK